MSTSATTRADRAPSRLKRLLRRPGRSIGVRLIACFAMIVLLMIAADAVAILELKQVTRAAQRIADVDEASLAIARVHFEVATFRDGMAELASSHDVGRFAGEAASIRQDFLQNIDHARQMVERTLDTREDAHFFSALEILRGTLLSQLDATLELARSGEWNLIELRLTNQVRALIRFSSQLVEGVDRQVQEGRSRVIEDTRHAQRRFAIETFAAGLLTLLAAAALGWHVTRSITAPLRELTRGAGALARGDFHHRVAVGGDDELAILGKAFDDAARQLQQLYEDLRRSAQTIRDVVNAVPAHVWSATPDGAVDFTNERLQEFTGIPPDEIMGWNWVRALHPDDRAGFVAAWRAGVSAGRPMESEVRLRRTDGLYTWFLVRNVPVRDEGGIVVRWYGSGIEIEDRKRAEQERERLRRLEAEIAHINRVSVLGELTASIAHDVKQPISATISNASACLRWLNRDPLDVDELRRTAQSIINDGWRAAQIIDRVRSLYKKASPKRELLEMNEIVREMVSLLQSEAARHAVSIRTDLATEVPRITADRVQLQQVFMNLMLNAIEAMKEAGGVLAINSQMEAGGLRVSVSDTGVGLPAEKADQIFDAFFTTKPQGSGMGLAISRSIVESHGGRLWATPNDGAGATFHFTLPGGVEQLKEPASGS